MIYKRQRGNAMQNWKAAQQQRKQDGPDLFRQQAENAVRKTPSSSPPDYFPSRETVMRKMHADLAWHRQRIDELQADLAYLNDEVDADEA
jgi:hypothetical protein